MRAILNKIRFGQKKKSNGEMLEIKRMQESKLCIPLWWQSWNHRLHSSFCCLKVCLNVFFNRMHVKRAIKRNSATGLSPDFERKFVSMKLGLSKFLFFTPILSLSSKKKVIWRSYVHAVHVDGKTMETRRFCWRLKEPHNKGKVNKAETWRLILIMKVFQIKICV